MSTYYSFNEHAFRGNVKKALEKVETILKADRRPLLAEEIHHKYENKYDLANHMTNIAIVAQMNVLERLGLAPQIIQQLVENVKTNKKTVTLRFEANETCKFLKEQTVDVPDPHAVETVKEKTSTIGSTSFKSKSSTIHKVIRKVKEYHWAITSHRELTVFLGTDVEKKTMIQSRDSSTVVITQSQNAPMEKVVNHTPIDLNLTWLLEQIDTEQKATTFSIDTSKAKTPRRNAQVEASLSFFASRLNSWSGNVKSHFSQTLQRFIRVHNPAVPHPSHPEKLDTRCSADDLFLPILPVLEERSSGATAKSHQFESISTLTLPKSHEIVESESPQQNCRTFSRNDTIQLLNAQAQSIDAKLKSLGQEFPTNDNGAKLISMAEATMYLLLDHAQKLCSQYQNGIGYLEHMLEKQLVAAIGKRVTNKDLEDFVRFHNAKFLTIPPKPFCHAIGRPNRFPYGVLSIEKKTNGNDNTAAIETLTRPVIMSAPLEVPLNAATSLQLTGNTYLHGWLRHRSEQGEGIYDSYQLSARARQFSSFLLVIGTMASGNKMIPKDAIILQNKDEVLIPLLLDEIPSAKEFKNAIESLSPEQQQFAQSFRGMQLESSVFGVAVIQIKPQLETLLGLPEDSLAKEIKLTEDLMELFVEHQVPSDLLSFDDNGIGTQMNPAQKVDIVRQNVKAVMDVIEDTKVKQLEKTLMEEEARKAEEAKKAEEMASALEWLKSNDAESDSDDDLPSEPSLTSFKKIDNTESSKGFGSALDWLRKRQSKKSLLKLSFRGSKAKSTEEVNLGGTTTYSRTLQEPEYEDDKEYRKTKYEQYDRPGGPSDPFALRRVEKPPPPPQGEDPYSLEHFTPDGGVVQYERTGEWSYDADGGYVPETQPEKKKTEWQHKKYKRPAKQKADLVDNRKQRNLGAYNSGGDIFDQLDGEVLQEEQKRAAEMSNALDWLRSNDADELEVLDLDLAEDGISGNTPVEESKEQTKSTSKADDTHSVERVSSTKESIDFTKIPSLLDSTIERYDKDSNLRSTKLKASNTWSRKRQPDLLTKATTSSLYSSDIKSESNKAYDLLDAISRSGSLPIAYSDLHVVVCVTHCFEKDIMATVVEDNVNPIEKLEKSTLLLGSAIHGVNSPLELIAEQPDRVRFESSFPATLEAEEETVDC